MTVWSCGGVPTVTIHRLHDQQMRLWVSVFARLLATHHWYSRHPPSSRTGHRRCCCRRCHPVAAVIVEVLVCFSRRGLSGHWFGGLSSQWRAPARRGQQSWPRAQGRGPGTAWPWPWASVFLFLVEDESRCLAFPTTDADEDADENAVEEHDDNWKETKQKKKKRYKKQQKKKRKKRKMTMMRMVKQT